MPIIIDAHQDLAWNALTFNRNYHLAVAQTRQAEQNSPLLKHSGTTLIGLPEYLAGQVALIFGTLFVPPKHKTEGDWEPLFYTNAAQAHKQYAAQLDYYERLADEHPTFMLVRTQRELDQVLTSWAQPDPAARRVGVVLLMEGADGVREPAEVAWWQERGVRLIGPVWTATRYGGGTAAPGPLTPAGRELLSHMADQGLILDLAHASDETFLEALERFEGVAVATHANPRALMKTYPRPERFLSDEMIRALSEHGGVMGVMPFNKFLKIGWQASDGRLPLATVVTAIDHICQVTGSAQHVALGSDFDGGFGAESVPAEIDTVADLQKLEPLLRARGYQAADIEGIFHANWLRILRRGLPT